MTMAMSSYESGRSDPKRFKWRILDFLVGRSQVSNINATAHLLEDKRCWIQGKPLSQGEPHQEAMDIAL